jgi:hypothetical protein
MVNILLEENEEDEPAPMVDLLTIRNLQKTLKVFEDSFVFLQNLDTNYEHRSLPSETFVMQWRYTT